MADTSHVPCLVAPKASHRKINWTNISKTSIRMIIIERKACVMFHFPSFRFRTIRTTTQAKRRSRSRTTSEIQWRQITLHKFRFKVMNFFNYTIVGVTIKFSSCRSQRNNSNKSFVAISSTSIIIQQRAFVIKRNFECERCNEESFIGKDLSFVRAGTYGDRSHITSELFKFKFLCHFNWKTFKISDVICEQCHSDSLLLCFLSVHLFGCVFILIWVHFFFHNFVIVPFR